MSSPVLATTSNIVANATTDFPVKNDEDIINGSAPINDSATTSPVVTFHVVKCGSDSNLAPTDYSVQVKNTTSANLYNVIEVVIQQVLEKNNLTNNSSATPSHQWQFTWDGKVYKSGQRAETEREYQPFIHHIDEQEPYFLHDMNLAVGKEGYFCSHSCTFVLRVKAINDNNTVGATEQPQLQPLPISYSDTLSTDWITPDEMERMAKLAEEWEAWYNGTNEWKQVKGSKARLTFELVKPTRPDWNSEEDKILGFLLQVDAKFMQSWTTLLRYAFPERTKAAASARWYLLRSSDYSEAGMVLSGAAAQHSISMAKRWAREKMLQANSPVRKPNPLVEAEQQLRKRRRTGGSTTGKESQGEKMLKMALILGLPI